MRLLRRLLWKNWYLTAGTLGILLAANAAALLWNTYISRIVNTICDRQPIVAEVIGMSVLCIVLQMLGQYAGSYLSGWTGETINHNLRMGFTDHLMKLSLREMENLSVGGQMSLLQNEIAEVSSYFSESLPGMVNALIAFLMSLLFLWFQNPWLTIISNLPVVFILIYVTVTSKVIARYARKSQEYKQQLNAAAVNMTGIIPVIHLYDCGSYVCNQYNQIAANWENAFIQEEKVRSRLQSLSACLSCIPALMLLVFGGIMVIHGQTTVGTVYIFLNLSKNVAGTLMNLPGFIVTYRRFLVNLDRLENKIEL